MKLELILGILGRKKIRICRDSYGVSISSMSSTRADSSKPSVHIKYEALQDLSKAVWDYSIF